MREDDPRAPDPDDQLPHQPGATPVVPSAAPPAGKTVAGSPRPFGIFISYRRDDSAGHAGRLFDKLARRYGRNHVFMDVVTIRPGVDFPAAIDSAIAKSNVALAIIGNRWADAASASGGRRLDDPNDFVRLEIATALKQDLAVIPVLVQRAGMPHFDSLPGDLQPLARRHAIDIDDARWDLDVERLIHAIDQTRSRDHVMVRPRRLLSAPVAALAAGGVVLAVGLGITLGGHLVSGSPSVSPSTLPSSGNGPSLGLLPKPSSPSASASAQGTAALVKILLNEDLSQPVTGLPAVTTANCSATYTNGFVVTARGVGLFCAQSTAPIDERIASLQDVSVQVDATYSQFTVDPSLKYGPGDAAVICRLAGSISGGDYYVASLSPTGYWDVDRFKSGVQERLDSATDPLLATPLGGVHRLRLDCTGPPGGSTTVTFLVDGNYVAREVDPDGLGPGATGFGATDYGKPEMTATFHGLEVRGP